MALGFVQGTFNDRGTSGTVVTKAFTTNATAGDVIFAVCVTPTGATGMTFTMSAGTASVTWNALGDTQNNVSGGTVTVYRNDAIVNSTGSCTITATSTSSVAFANLYIGEFNVGGHALTRDGSPNSVENTQATTTSFQSGSITTSNNPDVLICWYSNNGSTSAFTGGITSGWAENVWDSSNQTGFAGAVVTTPAAYSLAATQTSGGDDSIIYAYQATAVTITPVNATVSLAGEGAYSHGGRLLNNATVSI